MEISLEKEFELEVFFLMKFSMRKIHVLIKERVLTSQGLEFALIKKHRKL